MQANSANVTVNLDDTSVTGNTAMAGGGMQIVDGAYAGTVAQVNCTSTGSGGVTGNTASNAVLPGGGVYLVSVYGNGVGFSSTACDLGAESTSDDNTPYDTFVYGVGTYDYGLGASFSCDGTGCR